MKGIGIIGGSGVYNLQNIQICKEHLLKTPFGMPSGPIVEATCQGQSFFFLARHGNKHVYLPSDINYRANIYALKMLGVEYCISVSAVGSLKEECAPGTFVLPNQMIDWTRGNRARTFFGDGSVGHVSMAHPINVHLKNMIADTCKELGIKNERGGTYICIEGPQFSTKAESGIYRSFNATIIGMTNIPEAYLAKEAGMAYAIVAMVTDYDCWKDEHCTVEDIMRVMKQNYQSVNTLLGEFIPYLGRHLFAFEKENQVAILTPLEALTAEKREILSVLLQ